MANNMYNIGREGFLTEVAVGAFTGKFDWVDDNIGIALLDEGYVLDLNDTTYADISAFIVAETLVAGKSSSGEGTATASNTTFTAVSGDDVGSVVIFRSDNAGTPGTPANCPLLLYLDEGVVPGVFPLVVNGGDITLLWNNGTGDIFRL